MRLMQYVPPPRRQAPLKLLANSFPQPSSNAGWMLAGFMVGAVFWHFVGFWAFVADVFWADPDAPRVLMPVEERAMLVSRETEASRRACIALVQDSARGLTVPRPCALDAPYLPFAEPQGRQDLAGSVLPGAALSPALRGKKTEPAPAYGSTQRGASP